jgi:two-component system nitrate/nitrite response regulator NarL
MPTGSAHTKVVILSACSDGALVTDAIAQGAQGFVGKEKPLEVIDAALATAHQGHLAVDRLLYPQILRLPHPEDFPRRRPFSPSRRRSLVRPKNVTHIQ